MEEHLLEANGLRFRCLAAGPASAPLALLLHGFPEGAESWAPQLAALSAAGLWVVAPDLRGYGGSDSPEDPDAYRVPHLIADVEGLLGALGRDRCHLAGHDWGALVGWSVASYRPGLLLSWSALSVGHPAALTAAARDDEDQRQRSRYIELFRTVGKAERVLAEDGYLRLRRMYRLPPNPDAIPGQVVEAYIAGFSRPGRLTAALNYYRANFSREARRTFPPAPNPISVPTQLIWGDSDPALGRVGTEATERYVTGDYRLTVLEGAGHWLQFERPGEVSTRLVDWIASH